MIDAEAQNAIHEATIRLRQRQAAKKARQQEEYQNFIQICSRYNFKHSNIICGLIKKYSKKYGCIDELSTERLEQLNQELVSGIARAEVRAVKKALAVG